MIMHTLLFFLTVLGLTTAAPTSNTTSVTSPPDTVNAHRRGVSFNNPSFVHYFDIPNNQVGWCYNWSPLSEETNAWFEFVPMLWGANSDSVAWMKAVTRAANAQIDMPTHLLGFNEPDNCQPGAGGSCISVSDAVTAWKDHMQPAKSLKDKMYLGSPAVTNGANGMGLDWLKAFMEQCDGCDIDFICIHWYDSARNAAYFKQHITNARALAAGRPIWITEFYPEGTDDEIKAFLTDVIPWMDASGDIHRYAMFMAREGLLLDASGSGLNEVGKAYAEGAQKTGGVVQCGVGYVKEVVERGKCLHCEYLGWCFGKPCRGKAAGVEEGEGGNETEE